MDASSGSERRLKGGLCSCQVAAIIKVKRIEGRPQPGACVAASGKTSEVCRGSEFGGGNDSNEVVREGDVGEHMDLCRIECCSTVPAERNNDCVNVFADYTSACIDVEGIWAQPRNDFAVSGARNDEE